MFYYLHGTLAEVSENVAVIDCTGVGYCLTVSTITYSKIAEKIGEAIKLYTYLSVKEDGVELFGFETLDEKNMFTLLTTVSGVGPKAAINILSILSPSALSAAIIEENVKAISNANGVGAKTAARIVLDLKDKVSNASASDAISIPSIKSSDKILSTGNYKEAAEALYSLGYDKNAVATALSGLPADMAVVDMIRNALKKMAMR